ncbi:glycoside hydrolase family 3 protein [Patellaria atrata CBS 101060]|uniref:beta-glucosidase n=1 Tax=Patellaria atrata CBS 101060 TaxID=1346257 RepID=A0A9P4SH91_9PEZI|nr:glycoside hydrolase family 3 protein [Patellaria atrata CBS 101060]
MKLEVSAALLLAAGLAYAQDEHSPLWGSTSPPKYPAPWAQGTGEWAEAYAKAQEIVSQLTLLEKVNITTGVGWQGDNCIGNTGTIERFGIRNLCFQIAVTGVRSGDRSSAFPGSNTMAATWDKQLWFERGVAVGEEHYGKGVDFLLGPVISPLGRAPASGRTWEGISPDPVLSGIQAAQNIRGIRTTGVVPVAKHFLGNEQEHFRSVREDVTYFEGNITGSLSANIDDVSMHEVYLWPFADAVRAGVGGVMCSHNAVNNSQTCQNSYNLNYLLKGELGFQGFALSEWEAQYSGVSSALAGLDVSMAGDTSFLAGRAYYGANMTIAVLNGTIPEWRIDDMATRLLSAYFLGGRDQNPPLTNMNSYNKATYGYLHSAVGHGYKQINHHVDVRGDHSTHIRESANKAAVLLKNEGGLPLSKAGFTSVFGKDAIDPPYSVNGCYDGGCNEGTLALGWGSGFADFAYLISPMSAIQMEIAEVNGCLSSVTDNYAYPEIILQASQADQSIVFVNADSGEGYLVVDDNRGDRNNLTLWHGGDDLIETVASVSNNTIVVMHTVGAVDVTRWYDNPNVTAIVWAGLPGQESGSSIADILYGRVVPGGKLPFTWGARREDYSADVIYEYNNGLDAPQQDFEEGLFIDYRHFDAADIEPIWEFGFGKTYTTFEYSDISVEKHEVEPYVPTTGMTNEAPVLSGNYSRDTADYQFPSDINRVPLYIYPYLNSTDLAEAYDHDDYGDNSFIPEGATDGSPQPVHPAGGAPGGHPQLYDVMFTVSATITNTGSVAADEVVQLYVNHGGPTDPKVVLRNFDRLNNIAPGESKTFTAEVTRRDLSNWDPSVQNWVITDYPKTVYVGASSRKLHLSQELDI